jgi:magnesium chelatase family protein
MRLFRSPNYTISDAGMVCGGTILQPGEISLSRITAFFFSMNFRSSTVEVWNRSVSHSNEGRVTIGRAARSITFPVDFVLIAAMKPCLCGFLGDPKFPKYMGAMLRIKP